MTCNVAFIGLGVMGYPMAGYISKAGHNVTVFNRTKSKAEKWISEYKGKMAETPAEAETSTSAACAVFTAARPAVIALARTIALDSFFMVLFLHQLAKAFGSFWLLVLAHRFLSIKTRYRCISTRCANFEKPP